MDKSAVTASETTALHHAKVARTVSAERLAILYARIALGAAFLSAVADRFGLWGKYGGWGNFANFMTYTAQVNSFMPAFAIPYLAWAATVAESCLGVALILGLWPRWVALSAALLLATFGGHGDFLRTQVSDGLLRILGLLGSAVVGDSTQPQTWSELVNHCCRRRQRHSLLLRQGCV